MRSIVYAAAALALMSAPAAAQDSGAAGDTVTHPLVDVTTQPVLRNRRQITSMISRLYPEAHREQGVTGRVAVRFRVLENGLVDPGTIVADIGDPLFNDAAVAVVKEMRFTPARIGRAPVRVWVTVPVTFQLASLTTGPDLACGATAGCPGATP
jgi:TonB family protein